MRRQFLVAGLAVLAFLLLVSGVRAEGRYQRGGYPAFERAFYPPPDHGGFDRPFGRDVARIWVELIDRNGRVRMVPILIDVSELRSGPHSVRSFGSYAGNGNGGYRPRLPYANGGGYDRPPPRFRERSFDGGGCP
jgi:hypothetical protein